MGDLLQGQLAYVFLVAILDSALLSWLALRWYRGSVRAIVRDSAADVTAPAEADASALPASRDDDRHDGAVAPPGGGPKDRRPRRLVVAYCLAAAVHSAIITTLRVRAGDVSPSFVVWFAQWWVNAWPIVPTLVALLAPTSRRGWSIAGVYVAVGSAALALLTFISQALRGAVTVAPVMNVGLLIFALVWTASLPLALLLVTGWRRVRAVTPLALAATLVFAFAALVFREVLLRAFNLPWVQHTILDAAALSSSETVYYGLFMIVAIPVGWLAWAMVRGLAAGYVSKRFSDVQMIIDCWWLIVTAEEIATDLVPSYGLGAVLGGAAAFIAYRLTVMIALRGMQREPERPRRLLLLRVFGYQARTESLFDRIQDRWRLHGPVQLIGGVDLAMRTADPGDMLQFVNGNLAAQFVAQRSDVPQRLAELDLRTDPDGRFRVNELYCHNDTWRPMLEALLDVSDRVLMDLRSFSSQNAGCIFELEQIVARVATDNVVLVCDKTTDRNLLRETLRRAWRRARKEGRNQGTGRVPVVTVEHYSPREVADVMHRLLGIGEPTETLALADG